MNNQERDSHGLIIVPEYIICSAIYIEETENNKNLFSDDISKLVKPRNKDSGIVISGLRHAHCIWLFVAIVKAANPDITQEQVDDMTNGFSEQGFLTSHNNYLTREEAAEFIGICPRTGESTKTLFSEDLY
jgi:hypothetical protein